MNITSLVLILFLKDLLASKETYFQLLVCNQQEKKIQKSSQID